MDDINIGRSQLAPYNSSGSSKPTSIIVLKRTESIDFQCEDSTILNPLGVCGTQPCLNGGTCNDVGDGNFECLCHTPRFIGDNCNEDTDPCASSPCLFGGKCHSDLLGNYTCDCPPRMTGRRCDFGRFCLPNPCRNGGICEEGDNGPLCMCRGYMGPTCEVDVNECENQPCGSGASCVNEAGSFRCICPPDLTGASCGDPLYSNSITSKLRNIPLEHIISIISGVSVIFFVLVVFLSCRLCKRKRTRSLANNDINNDPRKEKFLSRDATASGAGNVAGSSSNGGGGAGGLGNASGDYKRNSKMSNLEIMQRNEQRPASFTASGDANAVTCSNVFVNNFDTLRSYGSAGDELENVPAEYRKPTRISPHIHNLNDHTAAAEIVDKQIWSDYLQLQSFSDNKINNGTFSATIDTVISNIFIEWKNLFFSLQISNNEVVRSVRVDRNFVVPR